MDQQVHALFLNTSPQQVSVLTVLMGCQTLPSLPSSLVQGWGPCKVELADGCCVST